MKTNALVVALAITSSLSAPIINARTSLNPVVTASRISQTADQTLTAVTVITSEDIKQSQNPSLPELLRSKVPGLDFTTTGGTGHQMSTFLRGTNSDHVLFLIDGVSISSATTGTAALELIPLEHIERIEIVRGPRSSLYGSEAVGGVIQVFTKKSQQKTSATIGFGSFNAITAAGQIGMGEENNHLTIAASHNQTDGFNVTDDSENDDDGFTNNAVNISFNRQLNHSLNMHARLLHSEGDTEFDNDSFGNVSDYIQQSFNLGFDLRVTDSWTSQFKLAQSQDRLESDRHLEDFDPISFAPLGTFSLSNSLFDTRREQLHIQNEITFATTAQLGFGIDYINDKVVSTTSYSETQRNNSGFYVLAQNKYDRLQIQAAARIDDNEAFGSYETGSIAASYDMTGDISISASHGTAFKAPSFNELYYVDIFFTGNPNLKPEKSNTTEIAVSGHQSWMDWALRTYHTEIKNLIVTNASFSSVENAAIAEIDGTELEISGEFLEITTNMNISIIDPIDRSTGNVLQNRVKQSLKLGFYKNIRKHDVSLDILAQSSRFANSSNTTELAGYAVVNLMIEKAFIDHKNWKLKARIDNIFDKNYSTTIDFYGNKTNNTPRSLFVSLSYLH